MTDDEVLERRARQLAQPIEETDRRAASHTLLRFSTAGARYAVELGEVREVVTLESATRVPPTAWPVLGAAAVNGQIVPIVALPVHGDAATPLRWGVVVDAGGATLCLPADEPGELVEVAEVDLTRGLAADTEAEDPTSAVTRDGEALLDLAVIARSIDRDRPSTHHHRTRHGRGNER